MVYMVEISQKYVVYPGYFAAMFERPRENLVTTKVDMVSTVFGIERQIHGGPINVFIVTRNIDSES